MEVNGPGKSAPLEQAPAQQAPVQQAPVEQVFNPVITEAEMAQVAKRNKDFGDMVLMVAAGVLAVFVAVVLIVRSVRKRRRAKLAAA